jgi:hypothetical protein
MNSSQCVPPFAASLAAAITSRVTDSESVGTGRVPVHGLYDLKRLKFIAANRWIYAKAVPDCPRE